MATTVCRFKSHGLLLMRWLNQVANTRHFNFFHSIFIWIWTSHCQVKPRWGLMSNHINTILLSGTSYIFLHFLYWECHSTSSHLSVFSCLVTNENVSCNLEDNLIFNKPKHHRKICPQYTCKVNKFNVTHIEIFRFDSNWYFDKLILIFSSTTDMLIQFSIRYSESIYSANVRINAKIKSIRIDISFFARAYFLFTMYFAVKCKKKFSFIHTV